MRFRSVALVLALTAALPAAAQTPDPVWTKVDAVFGAAGKDLPGGIHRFGWPRRDLHVRVGDVEVAPALALGSWGAFLKTGDDGKAMAMGDLVLLETELTPVVTALQAGGIDISAIHNHLVNESPHVVYVHFSGHGETAALAASLKKALEQTATPLTAAPPAKLEPADEKAYDAVQQALGRKGTLAGTVLQVGVPRAEKIEENGMEIPPTMGMANALNFQRIGDKVATTGDFVLLASEVNPVIRELRSHGIAVTALHSHMLAETPRLFFMHFWAVGNPETIGAGLKAALSKVNVKP
ncbi:MAG TPA: DUF1259 domain-containing protein [Thermoanaerobaculia bacterium]|jgi:hypothetical protein|nr:DUF1259 domain-containing protein [Thermoanaerobaculia bacterium]